MEQTTKYPEKDGVTCVMCTEGFSDEEWERRHYVHEPGCPLQNAEEAQCACEGSAHENHCLHCIITRLNEHLPLDSYGNIYTMSVEHVRNTVFEFMRRNPELVEKIGSLDMRSLAVEIQDYIGGVGIMDHIETAVSEAIRDQINRETETEDAQS